MPRNKEKQLTFDVPCEHTVTLIKYELEQDDFGNHNIYYIEDLNGKDHFEAFDGLHKKINDAGIIDGETFVIKKLQLKGYANDNPFFKIEGSSPMPKKVEPSMHKSDEKFIEQFKEKPIDPAVHDHPLGVGFAQKDDKAVEVDLKAMATSFHELSIRVENLEAEVLKLKKGALPF